MTQKQYMALALFFIVMFIPQQAFAMNQKSVIKTAQDLYLLSPLDNSEFITNTYSVVYNSEVYWVLETNDKDLFVIKDKNSNKLVSEDTIKPVIQTYLFFSTMKPQNNRKLAYYYNTIPDVINNFNYNIELVQKQLEQDKENDLKVINGLITVQSKAKNIGEISFNIMNMLQNIDSNLNEKKYDNFQNTKKLAEKLQKTVREMQTKLTEIKSAILKLKMILVDANISMQMKATIGNQTLQIPLQIQQIPQYNQELLNNLDAIDNTIAQTNDLKSIENLKTSWKLRLERANFLKQYLGEDKDIKKQTSLNNAKELFDTIIKSSDWKDYKDKKAFNTAYNKMYSDLKNKDCKNAQRQINPLKLIALKIFKDGKQQKQNINSTSQSENQNDDQKNQKSNIFVLASIVVVSLITTVIGIKYVKKFKKKKIGKDQNEPEVKLDF